MAYSHSRAQLINHKNMNKPEGQSGAPYQDRQKVAEPAKKLVPISETEKKISYLGVELEKAAVGNSQFVPKRSQYRDYINDKEIALPLQRDIAIAFSGGEPMLVEGGTSLGKTTTVRKMCAELGYEVHYANLNGATDVEDLMGRYIPNPKKNKPEDPEYIFSDGKVTSGLRQENGKIKVIILDEFNAAAPNIAIRLHEVLDALERNGEVVLSEDASEALQVSKGRTKIIALMNPPGKGYFEREPLDPAQLRRWVYKKMPSELPADTFSQATDALFSFKAEDKTATVGASEYLNSREHQLEPEQLMEIPGMHEVLAKYKEFHKAAKELVRARKIGEDQPQQFTYDDRMEPRRVRDFVLRFYNGDVNETFQQALKYYYSNKLESEIDRAKLNELIRNVCYVAKPSDSKRKGLERAPAAAPPRPAKVDYGPQLTQFEVKESAGDLESRALDFLDETPTGDLATMLAGLTGFDSERVWQFRTYLLSLGVNEAEIVKGLSGIDSERAWAMRRRVLEKTPFGRFDVEILQGLAGVDSDEAWGVRQKIAARILDKSWLVQTLAGLDSAEAWYMRDALSGTREYERGVLLGLAGVESKKAWNLRYKFLRNKKELDAVALSTTGIDSEEAWAMRATILSSGPYSPEVFESMAGLDSPRAWNMREVILRNPDQIAINAQAFGLAGLNSTRAWEMRRKLLEENAMRERVAEGISGDYMTFVWQLNKGQEKPGSEDDMVPDYDYQEFDESDEVETSAETIEDMSLDFMEANMVNNEVYCARGLAGMDSERAWKLRRDLLASGVDKVEILSGLAGVDSEEAWKFRNDFMDFEGINGYLAISLSGLDSQKAWYLRNKIYNQDPEYLGGAVAASLIGLDSEKAWVLRRAIFATGPEYDDEIALGLAGVDSEEAWNMRGRIHVRNNNLPGLAKSLTGLGSDAAWAMRRELLTYGSYDGIAQSLAGLDSGEAWDMRAELEKDGVPLSQISAGLAGLNSREAWSLRNRFEDSDVVTGEIITGINGTSETFVWRLKETEKSSKPETREKEKPVEGVEVEKFLDDVFDAIKISGFKWSSREIWAWSLSRDEDGKEFVDMQANISDIKGDSEGRKRFDKPLAINRSRINPIKTFYQQKPSRLQVSGGRGIQELKQVLAGKRVISVALEDRWYLEVV